MSWDSQAEDSDSVQRICERFAQLREQQQQEVGEKCMKTGVVWGI